MKKNSSSQNGLHIPLFFALLLRERNYGHTHTHKITLELFLKSSSPKTIQTEKKMLF